MEETTRLSTTATSYEEKQAVTVFGDKRKSSAGEVTILHHSKKATQKRALMTLLKFWGAAVLSVFIPIAHFVLVPLLFIGGPIGYVIASNVTSEILGGDGVCPGCGKEFRIGKVANRFPLNEVCVGCGQFLRIENKN